MGTRGSWGFVIAGQRWETYNHFDSYPDGLGQNLLTWARSVQEQDQWAAVRTRVVGLTVVKDDDKPRHSVLKQLKAAGLADPDVSTGTDFYAALRKCQGDPSMTLDSRLWIDATNYHLDALWCEWSYVFDLDRQVFEVWEGCQKDAAGEYVQRLVSTIPFGALPTTLLDEDGAALEAAAGDEAGVETPAG